jgi:hypothetical protein
VQHPHHGGPPALSALAGSEASASFGAASSHFTHDSSVDFDEDDEEQHSAGGGGARHAQDLQHGQHSKQPQHLRQGIPPMAAQHAKQGPPPQPAPGQQQQPQPQPQPQEQQRREEAPPARIIRAHTSRPPVARGLLHHVAKAFGIHLAGDVATNEISTAKYTLLTFLPVNLFEQFLRVANLYFLLMAILQFIPGLSPTSYFTTVAPLVFVLGVNAIKEGYDDVHRHRCVRVAGCGRMVQGRGGASKACALALRNKPRRVTTGLS